MQGPPPSLASRTASPLLPVGDPNGATEAESREEVDFIKSRNAIVAEGNVVAAATIFSASVVLVGCHPCARPLVWRWRRRRHTDAVKY